MKNWDEVFAKELSAMGRKLAPEISRLARLGKSVKAPRAAKLPGDAVLSFEMRRKKGRGVSVTDVYNIRYRTLGGAVVSEDVPFTILHSFVRGILHAALNAEKGKRK